MPGTRRQQGATERLVRAIAGEAVDRLISWGDSTDDGADDDARFECDPNDPRPVKVASPPGFYSVVAAGIRGLVLRLFDGGILLGSYTQAPSDAVAGEAGLNVGGAVVRARPDGTIELRTGGGAVNLRIYSDGTVRIANATTIELGGVTPVVLHGNNVLSGAILANHTHGLCPDPALVIGAIVGTSSSSATLLKGG